MPLRHHKSAQYQIRQYKNRQHQGGFTLLELMVAMSIFAMLAVVGWQVFDSVSRSKERAQVQFDVLTDLQYAYGQFQRDMMQTAAYQLPSDKNLQSARSQPSAPNTPQTNNQGSGSQNSGNQNSSSDNSPESSNYPNSNTPNNGGTSNNQNPATGSGDQGTGNPSNRGGSAAKPISAFKLENNQLSFIRYADPDPRYLTTSDLERVVYFFDAKGLVRERYTSLTDNSSEQPLQSVVIEGVTAGQFQVLLPTPSQQYPIEQSSVNMGSNNTQNNNQSSDSQNNTDSLLPKGVRVSFSVPIGNEITEISWIYALNKTPPIPDAPVSQ